MRILILFLLYLVQALDLNAPINNEVDFEGAFLTAVDAVWLTFWNTEDQVWNLNDPKCGRGFTLPSVWIAAVASKTASELYDPKKSWQVADSLIRHYSTRHNWFITASLKNREIYTDENAQVIWTLLDSYKLKGDIRHLTMAKKTMQNIQGQWEHRTGGVRWKVDGSYVAAISTSESALAAVRLFQITHDYSLLDFARNSITFLLNLLQDLEDKLFYDGIDAERMKIDKGKLTYTVGTTISTLVLLHSVTLEESYINTAYELARVSIDPDGALYNKHGYWSHQLQYVHLLFAGLADLIVLNPPSTPFQTELYQDISQEMKRQAMFVLDYLQVEPGFYFSDVSSYTKPFFTRFSNRFGGGIEYNPRPYNFCQRNPKGIHKRSLLNSASAAQIFYQMTRIQWL